VRAIAKLERDGLVRRIDAETIQILDIAGLRALQLGKRRRTAAAAE